jgi:hypothetical protein
VYLDHKQKVYQGLSKTLMADRTNVSGATALTMTLLSFVDRRVQRYLIESRTVGHRQLR